MEEYSRIIIEEYCMNHPKTKKADFLMGNGSYVI